jgi:chemotaxis protein methyltransferase CheR
VTLAASDFDHIRSVVRERSAILLEPGKEYLVEARLTPIAKARGLSGLGELAKKLTSENPDLVTEVVQAMTTNETSFFRDQTPFDVLQKSILPEIIARRRSTRSLNVWCGACSTGQEPYSVAITIHEHFPEVTGWDLKIMATDLSSAVIARAQKGAYRQLEVNRGLSASFLLKYFEREGLDFRVRPNVRSMVRFAELNLLQPWTILGKYDVVFLRNVLIYFDVDVKRAILKKVRQHMNPGSYLFLGSAESTMGIDDGFERAPFERASCYRLARH